MPCLTCCHHNLIPDTQRKMNKVYVSSYMTGSYHSMYSYREIVLNNNTFIVLAHHLITASSLSDTSGPSLVTSLTYQTHFWQLTNTSLLFTCVLWKESSMKKLDIYFCPPSFHAWYTGSSCPQFYIRGLVTPLWLNSTDSTILEH